MKPYLRSICFLSMLAVAAIAAPLGSAVGAEAVVCPRVVYSPILDSRLDDWPPLPQFVMAESSDWHPAAVEFGEYGGPDDISADVRLAWDDQSLYVLVEARDDKLVRVVSVAEIDRGDSIVLGFAGEDAEQMNQFVVALLKATSLVWRADPSPMAGEVRTVGRALAATTEDTEGSRLVYELAIPWSELKQIRPLPGTRFRVTVSACDDDGEGLKGCLERTVLVLLSTTGIGPLAFPAAPLEAPAPIKPTFPAPEVARFDERCFVLNDSHVLLVGGEIDYSRLPQKAWQRRINLLKAAGLNTVGVTVLWSYHQSTEGPADLDQLRAFLDLCVEAGLWVQLNVGPFAGARWEAGAVPGWVVGSTSADSMEDAADRWFKELLAVVAEYQLSNGGPVAYVVARPLPDERGQVTAKALVHTLSLIRSAGVVVPISTANSPAARNNVTQPLANLLDTLSMYEPVAAQQVAAKIQTLSREEVGPSAVTELKGKHTSPSASRESLDLARVALANGAAVVMLADFAPGPDPSCVLSPGELLGSGIIDAAGAATTGYGEARLLGGFVRTFGPSLVRAAAVQGALDIDTPGVCAAVRYGEEQAFLFLWDEGGRSAQQVRLSYLEPGSGERISIPEAGAIHLPPGGAKILPLDLEVGRGRVRYCTSEVAALHRLGARTLLVVYGDEDTPGEIAIRLPGPPLVSGDVARQRWDENARTLTLDYYHAKTDRYVLVDELEIAILSRERAARAHTIAEGPRGVTLVGAPHVFDAALDEQALRAIVDCPQGELELTAALPQRPSAVLVDGKPVDFRFTPPARNLEFTIDTQSFAEERRAKSFWDRLGRAIVGGPAGLRARFDRGLFAPDSEAEGGECAGFSTIAGPPESLGLVTNAFVRMQAQFDASAPVELAIRGSRYPTLVFLNGQFVPALSGDALYRRADVSEFLHQGPDEVELVIHILPRRLGFPGLADETARLPEVKIVTQSGEVPVEPWEVCPGLAGEASGFATIDTDARGWHHLRLGPWREPGSRLENAWGVGWYRLSFELPSSGDWNIPYYAEIDLDGIGKLYLNGRPVATVQGAGKYKLPLTAGADGGEDVSVLAAALYGLSPQTGLYAAEVGADGGTMTRRRTLEIRF